MLERVISKTHYNKLPFGERKSISKNNDAGLNHIFHTGKNE